MTQGNQPGIMRQQSFGRMPPQQMQMPPGNQPNMMRQQSFSGPPQGQMPGNNQPNMGRMSPQQMQQGNQPGIMRQQSFGRMSAQQMPQGNPVASPKGEPADTALPPLVRSTSILNRQSSFKKPKKKNSAINEPKLSQSADAGRNAGPSSHEAPLAAAPGLPRGEQTDFRQNSVSADDEARRLQEREREIMMMKQQQNMRENFQEERIAMERQREAQQRNATGVNRFLMAEENVRNNEKGEAKHRAAPQNGSPAPMTTEAPAPSEAPASRESPAPRVTPTATVTTSTSGAATPQPASTQSPVAEEKKSDPRMRFTAKLAVFEKPLQLGKRKKEPEDTSSHRVKTYGDDYCDIRVTMDDESIESFHVDELVAHRKGSSFVESKQLDGVVKMFTRGRNTCCFGFDEESHVSAQPLETPSWLVAQHVFASIAKCSDVSLDKNAEFVELYISFAAIKRKPDTPEEKTFEVLDLLAEGSVEFTGYRQVSHPLYGERLGGVTYRRVKSYQDFCKALLFAQSAAGTLRDTLEMKKQASSGDPLLAKECGSVIYVGSLIRKVVKGDIVVQGGVPAPDEVIDLSDSEVLGELQQNEDPGKLKLSSLEKCVNSLTFIGLQNQYDYIKPDCTLPLLQSLMSGPYYSVSIASVEPTSSGSVVPLNGMNSVCREHEKPLSGSVVRQLKSVRKEMQTLQAKIDSVRNGSAEQRELKVLLKKLQSKLSPLEESAQEPLQRLFSMVATE
ncbi:hypothetical protein AGDE_13197 [Angomonas deanei]|uniref:Uncharacterized protein n=1 Tax=Angomonas deanei TaxID=59799 RepID=A0A7G2CNN4_9TRYP|nr:hypothetical protein AGDE_13197 [Angomonas deanei]CAD2221400.1 hypothetical protein, conserved [Angomonas deanei]|eukprot:EPY22553.1 hypothetical protein AGDE_13197 [Angomonas deanei]